MAADLQVHLGRGLRLKNPVIMASGCFGYGKEFTAVFDVSRLGAVTGKSLTPDQRDGNPMPRLAETPAGLVNSVGLPCVGAARWAREDWPVYRDLGVPIILSLAGESVDDFKRVAKSIAPLEGVAAWELNMSCPNIGRGIIQFGQEPDMARELLAALRPMTDLPIIAKLAPMVPDIGAIAKAVVDGGADCIALVNSFPAMAIDTEAQRPILGAVTGGLSGPAIRPIALYQVWEAAHAVDVPIIGTGGISTPQDAIQFILAGASAVGVGTACFVNPNAPLEIIAGVAEYLDRKGYDSIQQIVGLANRGRVST